ncbi:hypothetical protein BKA62DRAFT_698309 [Auriculariales sp. MPI-PUGE-AT-0066]|nr:hypothetical protein BKA62DRAFT_698309 [Auriculariales sp. MPI-PUGE-AT-0066]
MPISSIQILVGILAVMCGVALRVISLRPKPVKSADAAGKDSDSKNDSAAFSFPPVQALAPTAPWDTEPLPYRPFKWDDQYKHVMGIRPMTWETWIQLDKHLPSFLDKKLARVWERGAKVVCTLPGYEPQAREALSEIALFLSQRYPYMYACKHNPVSGLLKSVTMSLPLKTYEWDTADHDAMEIAGYLQQDDLAVLVEGSDGQYRLVAGSICLAGSWRLEDKIGETMANIHLSGDVPSFADKLQGTMERFFRALKVNKPVERNNYQFQLDEKLPWSDASMGDEDTYGHFPRDTRTVDDISKIFWRSERQTLRRLPHTRCLLFTIRTYLLPVTDIANELGVPGRLAHAIRTWPENVIQYKGGHRYKEALLRYLDRCHQSQINCGVLTDSQRDRSVYPF